MIQKKCIVITTINNKNDCLAAFAKVKGWELIITGDKKSPPAYDLNAVYLDIAKQDELFPEFSKAMPFNHYCRKNLGYLYAAAQGYGVIGESDDDNLPNSGWGQIPSQEKYRTITAPAYPNIYKEFTGQKIWPRGFPLDLVLKNQPNQQKELPAKVAVWQGLVDGDSDVDAVYRLTQGQDVEFEKGKAVALNKGVVSPFNSQNTIWLKEAFVYMYLPHTVTFRYTDILRSFVAQFGIWQMGSRLGFMSPTVSSTMRNFHNLLKDFADEVPMYTTFYQVIEGLSQCNLKGQPSDLLTMYEALEKRGIVQKQELNSVGLWLSSQMNTYD